MANSRRVDSGWTPGACFVRRWRQGVWYWSICFIMQNRESYLFCLHLQSSEKSFFPLHLWVVQKINAIRLLLWASCGTRVAYALFVCASMGGLLPTTPVLRKSLQAKLVTEGSHGYTPRRVWRNMVTSTWIYLDSLCFLLQRSTRSCRTLPLCANRNCRLEFIFQTFGEKSIAWV